MSFVSPTVRSHGYVWNILTLVWDAASASTGGGGGGDASAANQTLQLVQATATNTNAGTTLDLAVTSDAAGTLSAKLRGLVKILADVWDSVNHRLKVDGSGVTQPVSGTFWQVTQPVSLAALPALVAGAALIGKVGIDQTTPGTTNAVQANAGTNLNTSLLALETTQLAGNTLIGAVTETAPTNDTNSSGLNGRLQRIAQRITSLIALLPAALVGGRLDVNNGSWMGSTAATVGSKTSANSIPVVLASDQSSVPVAATLTAETTKVIGTVNPPALTKGTQGANGFTTQDLKDAGRNQTNYYMVIQIVTTATDALLALTGYKSGALVAATTTPAVVTAGKAYRINSITLEYTSIVTTEGSVRFTLRANLSGVVAIGSPVVCVWEVGQTGSGVSVAGKKNTITIPFPDGLEFAAGTGIGISQVGLGPTGAAAIAGYGRATINGYEY